ncbi:hypothetical protein DEA8626_00400 [Defluviimonas aquaemixtae]|uniref:SGNH hydrolase-type esterase domain-containing protein n=1 Tax=Albidovulum aquaemixtae TaxID=1542388 RepID=A0A2R8B2M7_9RHOB|nr:SGNH/GDSL hydrolase family protein [Defluviimonas aquaemixtae]SPH16886.1 hypothetical protein DEA8626_00400 [Defluviimonas aquaemixtae]
MSISGNCENQVAGAIAYAFAVAQAGKAELAANAFSLARQIAVSQANPAKLAARIDADTAHHKKERDDFAACFQSGRNASGEPLLIFSDSLGLPRVDQRSDGAARTYSGLLAGAEHKRRVTAICQRFFTTDNVLAVLQKDETLGRDSDVLIHVGLNDCANRMFLAKERLALGLLTPETNKRVVEFARRYRRDILRYLPSRNYVPLERFSANLSTVTEILKARGVRKLILSTIVLPPTKFWPATPGINRGFAKYNMEIMDAVHRHDLILLDVDRIMWENHSREPLMADGMHLSDLGHQLLANHVAAL